MENLPNNDNNIENEEFSTIFSDPTEHKEKTSVKKNTRFLKALSLLLVVALIIGGTVAVIKLIPEKEESQVQENNELEILDYYSYDIKEVTVKNKNGSFNLYSKLVTATDEATGEEMSETFWYLKGYSKDLTESDTIENIVDAAVDMDAIREITTKTAKECGLEKPTVTVKATDNNGESFSVKVGDKSPDSAGVYVKTSKSDKIYLVGDMLDETLTFTDLDLASLDANEPITLDDEYKSYVDNGVVASFDTMTVSGKSFPKDIVFKINQNEELAAYIPYYLVSPMERTAECGNEIFAVFSQGFAVSGAYAYDAKESTLKKLGLDNPDYVISVDFDGYTYSYKFKKQKDGDYAVIGNDSKNVKKVTISDCPFLDYTTTDFYSDTVFITPIDSLKSLKLETENGTYDFSIAPKENGDSVNEYIIECGGKTYNSSYFQNFYQYIMGMQNMDFDISKISDGPTLTITFTYSDSKEEPTVIKFYKFNATKYQYSINDVDMGKIGSSTYNKLHKNLERLLAGKQVIVN